MAYCVVKYTENDECKVKAVSKIWIENGILTCPKSINIRNVTSNPKRNWKQYECNVLKDSIDSFEEAVAMQPLYSPEQNCESKEGENYRKKLKRRHPANDPLMIQSNKSATAVNKKVLLKSSQSASDSKENDPNKMNSILVETSKRLKHLKTKGKKNQKITANKLRKETANKAILQSKYVQKDGEKSLAEGITEGLLHLEHTELKPILTESSSVDIAESLSRSKSNENPKTTNDDMTAEQRLNCEPEIRCNPNNHQNVIMLDDCIIKDSSITEENSVAGYQLLPTIYKEVLKIKAACASETSKRIEMETRLQANFDKLMEAILKITEPLFVKEDDQKTRIVQNTAQIKLNFTAEPKRKLVEDSDIAKPESLTNVKRLTSQISYIAEEIEVQSEEPIIDDETKNQVVELESGSESDNESCDVVVESQENVHVKAPLESDVESKSDVSDSDSIHEPPKSHRDIINIKLTLIDSKGAGSDNFYDERGYLYSKNNVGGSNRLYLRCKNSTKYSCFARATVDGNDFENAVLTTDHIHPAEPKFVDRAKFSKKLDENCKLDPFATAQVLYLRTKQQLIDIIDTANIPSQGSFDIERRKREYLPKLPHTIDEFQELIAHEKYRQHLVNDLKKLPFYRGVWTSSKGEGNVVYISETVLKLIATLKEEVTLFGDGTQKVVPKHMKFRQLYIISVIYKDQCYPLAYILMERKTITSYDAVFTNLKLLMPSVEVTKVMTDYESATRNALRKHYPNARICGCFFHYVQAVMKNSKRFGLRDDPKFHIAIKEVAALALLPNEFVVPGFHIIDLRFKNKKSQRWNKYKAYWLKQWSKANISVYGLVHRTNNFSESFNKNVNQLVKEKHPTLWVLLSNLKLLEMNKSDEIQQASRGKIHVPKTNNDMNRLNDKIAIATKLFNQNEDVSDFLQHVTYEEDFELFVRDRVDLNEISVGDNEIDEEVIPNDYNIKCDFRKRHPGSSK